MISEAIALTLFWWQVVDTVKVPPPTKEIAGLLEQLGDQNYYQREKATKELAKMGLPALKGLELATTSQDLEISTRAKRLVEIFYNVLPTGKDFIPSFHSIPDEYEIGGQKYKWNRYKRKRFMRMFIPETDAWDWEANKNGEILATEAYVKSLLRSGVPRKEVVALLDQMAKIGIEFNGSCYPWDDNDYEEYDE